MENKPFRVSQELWDTLSEEQRKELNNTLEQHKNFVSKELEQETNEKLNKEKQTWEQEQLEKEAGNKLKNDFLGSVPENNKKQVETLLGKGFTIDEVKNDFPQLVKEPEQPMPDLNALIDGRLSQKDKEAQIVSDAQFMEKTKKHGINANDKEAWKRWDRLRKQNK